MTSSVDAPAASAARAGDRATIRALRDALRTAPGWFSLDTEIAIPSSLVRECYARARSEFFSLPARSRLHAHTQYARETGGYVPPPGGWRVRPNEIAIIESFDTVRDVDASRYPSGGTTGVGPVDWPLECPGMKTALRAFYEAADEVARDLLRALARAFVGDGDEQTAAEVADADALAGAFSPASPRRARAPCARCGTRARRTNACARASAKPSSGSPQPRIRTRNEKRSAGSARDAETKRLKTLCAKTEGDATRSVSSSKEKHSARASRSRARAGRRSPSTPISSVLRCCTGRARAHSYT